ncbi:transcription factor bHLH162-like isoform X2 [Zingiber officinale]|uniref:transcription factor bHLH162-like isoform X2 n=1 Tax=Zingiber officinale TaxID=94328 RepID=UPI001C4D6FF3|nr:transcription factor bHLH162-like isoform X2 [Zingiber officinale]XP_042414808.1 transcription factor bHLH162-like isoform X2 [Zingiber officinale]
MESSARPERKTIEKNRRIYMKALYSQLVSLLSTPSSREGTTEAALTLPEKLDKAIDYIKEKQGKLENMRKRKRHLSGASGREEASGSGEYLPKIEVQELRTNLNSGLRVVIVSSPWEHQEVFWEAIRVMEVEGFEVANASYTVTGDKAFHIVQCH